MADSNKEALSNRSTYEMIDDIAESIEAMGIALDDLKGRVIHHLEGAEGMRAEIAAFREGRKDPVFAAKFMSDFVNSMTDRNNKFFVEEMACEHRTLQQNFTRLCVAWLEHLAFEERHDARNEASVRLAREFVEKISSEVRFLPTV